MRPTPIAQAALFAITVAGCEPLSTDPAGAVAAARWAEASDLRQSLSTALEDARGRILPGLGMTRETVELAAALNELAGALVRPVGSVGSAAQRAREALDRLGNAVGEGSAHAADLTAITLVLDRTADLNR